MKSFLIEILQTSINLPSPKRHYRELLLHAIKERKVQIPLTFPLPCQLPGRWQGLREIQKCRLGKSNVITPMLPCRDQYVQIILGWCSGTCPAKIPDVTWVTSTSASILCELARAFYYLVSSFLEIPVSFCSLANGHKKWSFTHFFMSFIYTLGNWAFYTHCFLSYIPLKQFLNLSS